MAPGASQMIEKTSHAVPSMRDEKVRQYRRLYVSCFIVFLIVTAIDRLLPRQWRFRHSAESKSIVEEAREQSGDFVPYLFMNL